MTSRLDWNKDTMLQRSSPAGKGDTPRNVGDEFKKNYDLINWTTKEVDKNGIRKPARYRKVYR